jgi:hypothetical protein
MGDAGTGDVAWLLILAAIREGFVAKYGIDRSASGTDKA